MSQLWIVPTATNDNTGHSRMWVSVQRLHRRARTLNESERLLMHDIYKSFLFPLTHTYMSREDLLGKMGGSGKKVIYAHRTLFSEPLAKFDDLTLPKKLFTPA